jgi:predicted secreted Zn-dependent protease
VGYRVSLAAALAAVALCCGAQVFRWTDSEGRVHYGDRPPDARSAKPLADAPAGASGTDDVKVADTTIDWFEIRGFSSEEIRASMLETAPYSAARQSRVWGQCRWWFEWEFAHRVDAASCRIDRFTLKLLSEQKLPRWVDAGRAPEELRRRWDDFDKRLRRHEDGHKGNGIKAAIDLARRIRALPEFKTCAALNDEIVRAKDRVYSEYRLLDDAFDRVDLLYLKGFQ